MPKNLTAILFLGLNLFYPSPVFADPTAALTNDPAKACADPIKEREAQFTAWRESIAKNQKRLDHSIKQDVELQVSTLKKAAALFSSEEDRETLKKLSKRFKGTSGESNLEARAKAVKEAIEFFHKKLKDADLRFDLIFCDPKKQATEMKSGNFAFHEFSDVGHQIQPDCAGIEDSKDPFKVTTAKKPLLSRGLDFVYDDSGKIQLAAGTFVQALGIPVTTVTSVDLLSAEPQFEGDTPESSLLHPAIASSYKGAAFAYTGKKAEFMRALDDQNDIASLKCGAFYAKQGHPEGDNLPVSNEPATKVVNTPPPVAPTAAPEEKMPGSAEGELVH